MRLRELRAELPEWRWTAERRGMGWCYVGRKGDRRVTLSACGVLRGPGEDDYATQWRTDEGETYASFWLREVEEGK